MKELCLKIMQVPMEIRSEALKKFIKGCRWIYAISFFQWRLHNKNTIVHGIPNNDKEEDLSELIGKYVQILNCASSTTKNL